MSVKIKDGVNETSWNCEIVEALWKCKGKIASWLKKIQKAIDPENLILCSCGYTILNNEGVKRLLTKIAGRGT